VRRIKRWFKIALGAVVTIIGAILIPIPGPGGMPITLAGLAILGSELPWARRLMEHFKRRTEILRSRKSSRLKRIGMIGGLISFYLVTGFIITRVF
jgi:uncharacterized protein (TIGR02611 family)